MWDGVDNDRNGEKEIQIRELLKRQLYRFFFILIFKLKFKTGRERKTAPFRAGESNGGECREYITV